MTLLSAPVALAPVAAQADHVCTPPQLDTSMGCIWPEQLGLRIQLGQPLGGTAILTELPAEDIGRRDRAGRGFYRVASSSLVLLLEGPDLIVREMFYIPR